MSEVVVDEERLDQLISPCIYYVMNVRVCVKKRNIPAIQSSSEQGGRSTRGVVGVTVFATSHSEFGGVSSSTIFNVY